MSGFFNSDQLKTTVVTKKPRSCHTCGLLKNKVSMVEPSGKFKKKIMILWPEPTKAGKATGGSNYVYLKKVLAENGVNIDTDCVNVPVLKCRPEEGQESGKIQIDCCFKFLRQTIKVMQPKLIIALGVESLLATISHSWKKGIGSIERWRGFTVPDSMFGCWICPVWHPSKPKHAKEKRDNSLHVIFQKDIKRALSLPNYKAPDNYKKYCQLLTDPDEICKVLKRASLGKFGDLISFDYESTGLKPQASWQKIICASISSGIKHTYSFPFYHKKWDKKQHKQVRNAWIGFLKSKVRKSAHNMKFEVNWSSVIFGQTPVNMYWDSMIAAHMIDNRALIGSLKFQTYVRYGVVGYDADVAPYIEGTTQTPNKMYEFMKKNMKSCLLYNALDSLFGYMLTIDQIKEMGYED